MDTKTWEGYFPIGKILNVSFNVDKKEILFKCEETANSDLIKVGSLLKVDDTNQFQTNFDVLTILDDLKDGDYDLYAQKKETIV